MRTAGPTVPVPSRGDRRPGTPPGPLLDSLGIERVHLVGPSVGGLIALSFACQFPERVGASSPSAPVTGLPLNTACPCLNKSWPLT
ncbi:MAG: alpha/beta fold hydrolase [Akkermansia sp.]